MKLMLIPPTPQLQYAREGHMHFVLAQRVIQDEKYRQFYASEHKYKLMDNGAYEDKTLSAEQLIEAARIIHADEIVAPDFPGHPKATYAETKDFISVCPSDFAIMAVPHGRTVSEYVSSFEQLKKLDTIDTLGISILDLWKFRDSYRLRPMVVHYLNNKFHVDWSKVHLLGLDEPLELFAYQGFGIRSVDTSLPFSLAGSYLLLKLVPERHERVSDSAETSGPYGEKLLQENIQKLKDICESVK